MLDVSNVVARCITSYKVLYEKNNKQWDYEDLKDNKFETGYYDLKESYEKYILNQILAIGYLQKKYN